MDVAVLALDGERLSVLLVKLKRAPYEGRWALPGGRIGARETVEEAAARELAGKTGLSDVWLEQLHTFSAPERDPAERCVSVAFLALVPAARVRLSATAKYGGIAFFPADERHALPFDHDQMVAAAVERLRELVTYTAAAWSLFPREFGLGELQRGYEAILGHPLDPRNFRKRLIEQEIVVPTAELRRGGAHRPARLYRFARRKPAFEHLIVRRTRT